MTAEQILSTDFLTALSGAIDRYYDSEAGLFGEGYEHFHNAAGQATLVKAAANELGLDCDIYGIDELPEGTLHPEGPGTGYDWALVGGRWIVDLWLVSYYGEGPVVYDLADPDQAAVAERTFGPRSAWEKLAEDPKEIELATRIWNEFTGPYRAVDDLLGGVTEWQCARLEAGSQGNTCGGSSPSPSAILDELLCESPKIETLKRHKQPLSPEEQAQVAAVKLPHGDCASWWKAEHDGQTWYVVHTHRAGQVRPSLKSALAVYPKIASTA